MHPSETLHARGPSRPDSPGTLAACPFCGALPVLERKLNANRIRCVAPSCGGTTWGMLTAEQAGAIWNRRAK